MIRRDMDDAALEQTIADLMQVKECGRCRAFFTVTDSIGAWQCRLHPGLYQPVMAGQYGTAVNTYSCCGFSPVPTHAMYRGPDLAAGCMRCDHSLLWRANRPLAVNRERADVLFSEAVLYGGNRPGIRLDEETGTVHIVRYEGDTAAGRELLLQRSSYA